MKKEAAARGVPLAAALPLDLLAAVCRALPAAFYFANPLVEPIVLRHLDIVFGGQAANGARELLDFGFSLCDAVLRHRGHTGGVDSLDEVHHLRQVCLGQLNALGVGDRKRFAHGGNKAATLLGARLRGASVGPAVGHAGLVDAVVEHEFGPHAVGDVVLDGMGDAAARIEPVDRGDGCGVRAGRRAKADFACIGKGERAVEKHGVHALADTKNGMLPAKAFGNLLLARNAVAQRGDERVGSHDALHSLECLVETGGLDCHIEEQMRWTYSAGQTAKTRAGYPTPSRTLGKVQKMTAPVAGSSSRWSMTSI